MKAATLQLSIARATRLLLLTAWLQAARLLSDPLASAVTYSSGRSEGPNPAYPIAGIIWIYSSNAALSTDRFLRRGAAAPGNPVLFSSGASSVLGHAIRNGWIEIESGGGNGRVYWNYHECPEFLALPGAGYNMAVTSTFKLTPGIQNLSVKDGNHGTDGWSYDGSLAFGGFGFSLHRDRVQSKVEYWHPSYGEGVTVAYPPGRILRDGVAYQFFAVWRASSANAQVTLDVWLDLATGGLRYWPIGLGRSMAGKRATCRPAKTRPKSCSALPISGGTIFGRGQMGKVYYR